jgi:hypothetical protein
VFLREDENFAIPNTPDTKEAKLLMQMISQYRHYDIVFLGTMPPELHPRKLTLNLHWDKYKHYWQQKPPWQPVVERNSES